MSSELETLKTDYQALKLENEELKAANERLNGSVAFDFDRLKHDEASYYKDMVTRLNAVIDSLKAENAELRAKHNNTTCIKRLNSLNADNTYLQSEVARLRDAALFYKNYADCQRPDLHQLVPCKCGFCKGEAAHREALNHKPKGEP